ncbi:MAG: hypothetical protein RLN81_13790 [Balneolaceae bacterium]
MDFSNWEPETFGFVGAIVGAIVGAGASIVTTALTTWGSFRMSKREREEKLKIESNAFQRQTLLQLLEDLKLYAKYISSYHSTVIYKHDLHKNDLINNEVGDSKLMTSYIGKNNDIATLLQRVLDDSIRNSMVDLTSASFKLVKGIKKKSIVEEEYLHFQKTHSDFQALVGKVLRENYSL